MLTSSKTLKLAAGLLIGAGFAPIAAAGGYGAPAYSPDLLPSNPAPGSLSLRPASNRFSSKKPAFAMKCASHLSALCLKKS